MTIPEITYRLKCSPLIARYCALLRAKPPKTTFFFRQACFCGMTETVFKPKPVQKVFTGEGF
jgi:hypothetical protein